ncbi:hypothetical protein ACIQRS_16120 [Streptomyces termitum]|uniref:Uncharacterized protein n=1 Tax=Streptomyces termitum TaxID=67368 RepID=A0A918T8N5_9ACTN|nr:hypothetical protein [Streptomyces termitum]GHB06730.1 hypothetical protein GCM10010305_57420 [Streptomyces termitum]
MSASLIVTSELSVKPDLVDEAAAAWHRLQGESPVPDRSLYRGLDGTSLLEFTPLSALTDVEALRPDWQRQFEELAPFAEGDFSRELLGFVEAPKPTELALPRTRYIQMRHVEVKPAQYAAYRDWREATIFDVVRNHDDVQVFLAYHSVLSSEPGVMFVSGFDCPPERYNTAFTSSRYQEIVRQAGDRYITGGDRGLYTKFYERVEQQR